MITAENDIWGVAFNPVLSEAQGVRRNQSSIRIPIAHQLHTFVTHQIRSWQPDVIIVIERKGTAILRALKEWNDQPFEWPWSKVISSDVIEQVPKDRLEGKRILVFDDTINTGAHLHETLSKLHQRVSSSQVRLAIFATHEPVPARDQIIAPDAWFYRNLTRASYHAICGQIVRMLQDAGSLMLDTEHIEVRLRLNASVKSFVHAMRRNSHAVLFHSSQGRTNITVVYEDDRAHELQTTFPEKTWTRGIVKKCRIVQRNDPDEFAIIPICFPSIPFDAHPWNLEDHDRAMLGENPCGDHKTRFYDVGLLGALEVLGWVLKDLAIWGSQNYSLSLPQELAQTPYAYDLQHLTAMYPTLDIGALTKRIANTAQVAEMEGNKLRNLKFEAKRTVDYPDEQLRRDAATLLSLIRYVLDERAVARFWTEGSDSLQWGALSLHEISTLAQKRYKWEHHLFSTLFDILIDEATLSTDIGPFLCKDGIRRVTRTFSPAGEVISDLVRRYLTQWGVPLGI